MTMMRLFLCADFRDSCETACKRNALLLVHAGAVGNEHMRSLVNAKDMNGTAQKSNASSN
jgi:hypothetical protein